MMPLFKADQSHLSLWSGMTEFAEIIAREPGALLALEQQTTNIRTR